MEKREDVLNNRLKRLERKVTKQRHLIETQRRCWTWAQDTMPGLIEDLGKAETARDEYARQLHEVRKQLGMVQEFLGCMVTWIDEIADLNAQHKPVAEDSDSES